MPSVFTTSKMMNQLTLFLRAAFHNATPFQIKLQTAISINKDNATRNGNPSDAPNDSAVRL